MLNSSHISAAVFALACAYASAQGSFVPQSTSPFTSPQAGAGGQVISMHLHPEGETGGCQTTVRVLNMHYLNMACTKSAADFSAKWLNHYHLKSKCPAGQPMSGVFGIDCVNAPTPGFNSGSVFSATVCCGVPKRPTAFGAANAPAPMGIPAHPFATRDPHAAHDLHNAADNHLQLHPRFLKLRDVALRMETTAQTEACPAPSARFSRHTLATPGLLWRNYDRVLDNTCAKRERIARGLCLRSVQHLLAPAQPTRATANTIFC